MVNDAETQNKFDNKFPFFAAHLFLLNFRKDIILALLKWYHMATLAYFVLMTKSFTRLRQQLKTNHIQHEELTGYVVENIFINTCMLDFQLSALIRNKIISGITLKYPRQCAPTVLGLGLGLGLRLGSGLGLGIGLE